MLKTSTKKQIIVRLSEFRGALVEREKVKVKTRWKAGDFFCDGGLEGGEAAVRSGKEREGDKWELTAILSE